VSLLAADLARALDPVALAAAVGIDPDPRQVDLLRSDHRQTILNCSRRSGKSATTAAIAVHEARYHPSALVLLLSPRTDGVRGSLPRVGSTTSPYRSGSLGPPSRTGPIGQPAGVDIGRPDDRMLGLRSDVPDCSPP
jgi:hypothetical protein